MELGKDGKLGHTAQRERKKEKILAKESVESRKGPMDLLLECETYFFFWGLGNQCSCWFILEEIADPRYIMQRYCVTFLECWDAPESSYMSSSSRASHFSKKPWFLSLENVTKIWALGELIAIGVSLLLASLSCQSNKIYMYTKPCMYVDL